MLSFVPLYQLSRIRIIFSSTLKTKAELLVKVAKSFPIVMQIWEQVKFVETNLTNLLPSNS